MTRNIALDLKFEIEYVCGRCYNFASASPQNQLQLAEMRDTNGIRNVLQERSALLSEKWGFGTKLDDWNYLCAS